MRTSRLRFIRATELFLISAWLLVLPSMKASSFAADWAHIYAEQNIRPWKSSRCEPPVFNFPRWRGFPVTCCEYSDIGVTVRTYMLNAGKARQVQWITTACRDAQATDMRKCIDYLILAIRRASSGGVFAIAGYIPEPQDGGVCYVFRDGVTIWTVKRQYWQRPTHNSCGPAVENDEAVAKAWKFARIASTTREDYRTAGGSLPANDLNWLDVTRKLYQKAWASNRNELISAKAVKAKLDGLF